MLGVKSLIAVSGGMACAYKMAVASICVRRRRQARNRRRSGPYAPGTPVATPPLREPGVSEKWNGVVTVGA